MVEGGGMDVRIFVAVDPMPGRDGRFLDSQPTRARLPDPDRPNQGNGSAEYSCTLPRFFISLVRIESERGCVSTNG